jgi:predicted molibdopterin-dependent oxidoreductase YjgC
LRAQSFAELEADAGTTEVEMRELAARYARARTAVIVYSMGLTQYEFGVDNVKMVVNFALARGMIGRPKCGIMPIRGHSGVQGSAECGADAMKLPGGQDITDETCASFEAAWDHPIPRRPGLRAAHLLDACHERGLELLYLIGGNHLETMPDRTHAAEALGRAKLRVHQDIVLNTSTLLDADEVLVLPAETRYEQKSGGTSTSTERRIRFTPEIPGPRIEEAKAEWEILSLIGRRLGPGFEPQFSYRNTAEIRAEMGRLIPLYQGIETLEREGDQLQWGGPQLGATSFRTDDGKAHLKVVPLPVIELPPGRFFLTSRRGRQFNSMTYAGGDPITGAERAALVIDEHDQRELGVRPGQHVRVTSDHGALLAVVRSGPCRRRHVQAFWPECNVLLGRKYDPVSGEPDYNTSVTIEPAPPHATPT